jgi:hypothetical protein
MSRVFSFNFHPMLFLLVFKVYMDLPVWLAVHRHLIHQWVHFHHRQQPSKERVPQAQYIPRRVPGFGQIAYLQWQ